MQHVFIVGSKSLGAYGGYETFVNKLTEYHEKEEHIQYHVACKANGDGCMDESKLAGVNQINENEFMYQGAHCFKIPIPKLGPAVAIYYDVKALSYCCDYIRKNHIKNPIVYILACRIGPFAGYFQRKIHKLGGTLMINPDGHEWMRAKWSKPIQKYWKISEQLMVKHSDLVVCDSKTIEQYIKDSYAAYMPKTTYIAYGAETRKSILPDTDETLLNWYRDKNLQPKNYYLVVGRFVPENNYETMIREFMKSKTTKDFALITNVSEQFLEQLKAKTNFYEDSRIKFVGTVYDQELLMKIRENAYGYLHGHEVGGTNPSLLEALGSTDLNLLLDVGFNRECGEDGALYWTKEEGNLASLLDKADHMTSDEIATLGQKATKRIEDYFSWQFIADRYAQIFRKEN